MVSALPNALTNCVRPFPSKNDLLILSCSLTTVIGCCSRYICLPYATGALKVSLLWMLYVLSLLCFISIPQLPQWGWQATNASELTGYDLVYLLGCWNPLNVQLLSRILAIHDPHVFQWFQLPYWPFHFCLDQHFHFLFDSKFNIISSDLISNLSSLCLPGHTGRFIRAVFSTSLLFVLAHICFQTVLYTYPPLNIAIGDNCSQWDSITRHIGLSRYVNKVVFVIVTVIISADVLQIGYLFIYQVINDETLLLPVW